jgi:TnpA family transposase
MPRRFLSKVERERLSQFPDEVTEADCTVYFTLTPADKEFVRSRRDDANRLGVALLLCNLRYLGNFPTDVKHTPENVVAFVAEQLELSPIVLADYAGRGETRWEHLPQMLNHLGFRRPEDDDRKSLIAWLGERALEHDRPSLLLQQACERLYQLRLVRPAITTMEELVVDARQWAEAKTIEVLVNPLPAQVQKSLDTLLVSSEEHDKSPILWLRCQRQLEMPINDN